MTTDETAVATRDAPAGEVNAEQPAVDTGLGKPVAQGADPIDRVVKLAPKWTLFVLGACILLVIGSVIWAFKGSVTTYRNSPGIFKDNGFTAVKANSPGAVESVPVTIGQQVAEGQTLLVFDDGTVLPSPKSAWVSSIFVAPGSKLGVGSTAMSLTDYNTPDVVVTLLPASMNGSVVAGLRAEIEVQSAPSNTYGYLKGQIIEVSSTPLTTDEVANILSLQPEVVAMALGSNPGLLAIVGLDSDPNNPTRYAWTVGEGPPFAIANGTPVHTYVILSKQPPVDVIFPGLTNSLGVQ